MTDAKTSSVLGLELNPKLIGALFTDHVDEKLRLFCYYTNGETSQFDVPAAENRENLKTLFAALKIDETCTSLILENVVMGRIYARHDGCHFLYTVLQAASHAVSTLDANILSVDWQVIWKMPGIEILRAEESGTADCSIAIRTQIGENDAARMMQQSKAFIQPVSQPKATPHRWAYLYIGLALLVMALLIGGTIYYNFRETKAEPDQAAAPAAATEKVANIYLLFDHKISGPFPAPTVQVMNQAGLLYPETMWRAENSNVWFKVSELLPKNQQP